MARWLLRAIVMIVGVLGFPAAAQDAPVVHRLLSPGGTMEVAVSTDSDGRPVWSLTRAGKPLIAPSKLGFLLTDGLPMVRGFTITGAATATADTRWELPWGERRHMRERYEELLVHFQQSAIDGSRRMDLRIRLFDDGIGLRYEIPAQDRITTMRIAEELTEFAIVPRGTAWWITGGDWNRYEQVYQTTPIDAVATAHTPITMRLEDGTHLAFHEAALVDYSAYWLKRIDGQVFRTMLAPSSQGAKAVRDAPFVTPWRTVRIAGDAAGLVESDLELNLNEPSRIADVSWFKPQKYVGIWWGMIANKWTWAEGERHGATTVVRPRR